MCKGISMVITRGRTEPYFIEGENSHHRIREEFSIRDDNYQALPVEFLPTGILTHVKDWDFTLDINTTSPEWFEDNKEDYKAACHRILKSQIRKIQRSGKYGGSLYLQGTHVKSLGSLQSVGGYLDLQGTQVKRSAVKNIDVKWSIFWN